MPPHAKTLQPGLVYEGACTQARRNTMAVGSRDGHTQHTLHGHSVAAVAPIMEEAAGALPLAIVKRRCVHIIFALERCFETSKLNALRLFGIALCFGNFADHT